MNKLSEGKMLEIYKSKFGPLEVEIGNATYLAGRDFFAKHSKCIYSFTYNRSKPSGTHYDVTKTFVVDGKLLEINASCVVEYGPLGDRCKIDVRYDGVPVSNFRSYISYMGGDATGSYPYIRTQHGHIVFSIQMQPSPQDNVWSIDQFEDLDIESEDTMRFFEHSDKSTSESIQSVDNKEGGFSFEDIQQYRKIRWRSPVFDEFSKEYLGDLSFCEYPGYNKVSYWVTGQYPLSEWDRFPDTIEKSEKDEVLQTLEFNGQENFEREIISDSVLKSKHYSQEQENLNSPTTGPIHNRTAMCVRWLRHHWQRLLRAFG